VPAVPTGRVGHNIRVTGIFIAITALVILGAALALTGRWGVGTSGSDRPGPPALPEDGHWTGDDVVNAKFRVGLRGYRMEDVDAALASLAQQLRSEQAGPTPGSPGADSSGYDPDHE
jgi:DivIVA domain-containing protein